MALETVNYEDLTKLCFYSLGSCFDISLASNISVEIAVLVFLSAVVSVHSLHSGLNCFRLQLQVLRIIIYYYCDIKIIIIIICKIVHR